MEPKIQSQAGGSFAPPITPEKLAEYQALSGSLNAQTPAGAHFRELLKMVAVFQETPPSTLPGTPHPSGKGQVIPLEQAEIERIWDLVPWDHECNAIGVVFDSLTGDVRNAAYHLLWYARELTQDREPITTDKI